MLKKYDTFLMFLYQKGHKKKRAGGICLAYALENCCFQRFFTQNHTLLPQNQIE